MKTLSKILLLCAIFSLSVTIAKAKTVNIYVNKNIPQIAFAAGDIKQALENRNHTVAIKPLASLANAGRAAKVIVALQSDKTVIAQLKREQGIHLNTQLKEQAYALRTTGTKNDSYWAFGGDVNGAMYGGLALADYVKLYGLGVRYNESKTPYHKKRGIKYNIPLDSRTPSYDSDGDAAHTNVKNMWDFGFWQTYFDTLARHRYNVISFWNSHPFTSLVKVPEYPEAAVQDVMDYKGLVKKMAIEEKMQFWTRVFNYAKDRGFDIYWFNWNVYAYGAVGKYGIEDNPRNEPVKEYSRKSLYAFLKAYPQIDAFGVSAGEHFGGLKHIEREKWMRAVWGQALIDFKKDHPNRDLFFIHRFLMTGIEPIMEYFGDFPLPWDISFKYAVGHMYGYHKPDFIYRKGVMAGMDKYQKKTWLNIRNDDIFYFRWAGVDYARQYLTHFPEKDRYIRGYYMGSDGYVFGKTFTFNKKFSALNNKLEIDKHWFNFMLFGRLGYDPTISESYFVDHIQLRYPSIDARALYTAWGKASQIFPAITSTIARDNDAQWWIEACLSKQGFISIESLLRYPPQPGAPIQSIAQFVKKENQPGDFTTPLHQANKVRRLSADTLKLVAQLDGGKNIELQSLLLDIEAMGLAGLYYADKIDGAVYHHSGQKKKAIKSLESALAHWKKYVAVGSSQYIDQYTARHNPGGKNSGIKENKFSWQGSIKGAERDLEIAKQ